STDAGPAANYTYPLNGKEEKRQSGASSVSTATKWEGSTLLVNMIVSGPQNYTMTEKWRKSRDGMTLTITRTVVRISGETESVLVYENATREILASSSASPRPAGTSDGGAPAAVSPNVSNDGPRPLRVLGSSAAIDPPINARSATPVEDEYVV